MLHLTRTHDSIDLCNTYTTILYLKPGLYLGYSQQGIQPQFVKMTWTSTAVCNYQFLSLNYKYQSLIIMAQINEKLIREVFDEMVMYKPSLAKYLVMDEEEEAIDIRILADQIIKNFPWPIGVELRRLFSGSMRSLERGRLDQLFKTIERTMQFLAFVMVIELYEKIRDEKILPDLVDLRQFKQRCLMLGLGNYAWTIRLVGKALEKNNSEIFMPEMKGILNNKFYKALDFWVPERNEIGHYQINLSKEDIEKRCVEYLERLSFILKSISFLVKYKLVTIREIKVRKLKRKDPLFDHWIDILNSSDSDFRSQEETFNTFSDSNAVLLMKSIKQPKDFLNLSPLIIDTRPEIIDSKDKFNLKKDIFMYTKYRENKIFYLGTEVTEKCDLSSLSNYTNLVEEFKEIIEAITTEPVT